MVPASRTLPGWGSTGEAQIQNTAPANPLGPCSRARALSCHPCIAPIVFRARELCALYARGRAFESLTTPTSACRQRRINAVSPEGVYSQTDSQMLTCGAQRPLLGVKRTLRGLVSTSADDPKRTFVGPGDRYQEPLCRAASVSISGARRLESSSVQFSGAVTALHASI